MDQSSQAFVIFPAVRDGKDYLTVEIEHIGRFNPLSASVAYAPETLNDDRMILGTELVRQLVEQMGQPEVIPMRQRQPGVKSTDCLEYWNNLPTSEFYKLVDRGVYKLGKRTK